MSSAVLFLLAALGAALIGSTLLWLVHHFPRGREPDYGDRLRAIAPLTRAAGEQPCGIVSLEPSRQELDSEHPDSAYSDSAHSTDSIEG